MVVKIDADKYRMWLRENITLTDPFSPTAMRILILHLFMGKNYRVITERNTKEKLLITYRWLTEIYNSAKKEYKEHWEQKLLAQLMNLDTTSKETKDLMLWLVGLTRKTAQNLAITTEKFPDFLKDTIAYCTDLFSRKGYGLNEVDHAWLLLMAGCATLKIRGSQKSIAGKTLEEVFLKVILTLLGLEHNRNFWVRLGSDAEVGREVDGEVETRRGRVRIDIGLIAQGNIEVIADKVGRIQKHGVVIFDKIGPRANVVYETAREKMVKLIQIRHGQPLTELYRHLKPLVVIPLREPPTEEKKLEILMNDLPDNLFVVQGGR